MLFDATLILISAASGITLWYRISQKIPQLVAIPDEIIIDRLHEDSARVRVFLLSFRRYWREREHHQMLLRYAEKALYKLHIFMLKADNRLVLLVKKVRAVLDGIPDINAAEPLAEAVEAVHMPQETAVVMPQPQPTPVSPAARIRVPRIQEVRRRRTKQEGIAGVIQS